MNHKPQVIISTDKGGDYDAYARLAGMAWTHFGFPCRFASTEPKSVGRVLHGKLLRLHAATQSLHNGPVMISDADMIPAQSEYFNLPEDYDPHRDLVTYGGDFYEQSEPGRYPICYLVATPQVWREITRSPLGESFDLFLKRVSPLCENAKGTAAPSDELAIKKMIKDSGVSDNRIKVVRRWRTGSSPGRLCRSNFHYNAHDLVYGGNFIDVHLPRPYSYQCAEITAQLMLSKDCNRYTSQVSPLGTIISGELAIWLINHYALANPQSIADLGSGFSTVVFSKMKQWDKSINLQTFDHDRSWLDRTKQFLGHSAINHNIDWNVGLDNLREGAYDLILFDYDLHQNRASYLPQVYRALRRGGSLVIDDVHFDDYRQEVKRILSHVGAVISEQLAPDELGRYQWVVQKREK